MGANILEFNGVVHSVVEDISTDSEAPVVRGLTKPVVTGPV